MSHSSPLKVLRRVATNISDCCEQGEKWQQWSRYSAATGHGMFNAPVHDVNKTSWHGMPKTDIYLRAQHERAMCANARRRQRLCRELFVFRRFRKR
jgi:hypothetical protein